MASISTAKKEMRSRIKKILAGVSADSVTSQSSLATERLLALPEYQSARRVSVYLSMPAGELRTGEIVRDAFRRGKQVFVPYIYKLGGSAETKPSSIMEMLALRSLEDYESLQPDGWGIPTLDASSVAGRENCLGGNGLRGEDGALKGGDGDDCGLDFIVVPGMAFDHGRRRLGHGKGYYDRFINRYRSNVGKGQMPYLGETSKQQHQTAQLIPLDSLTHQKYFSIAAFCLAEQVLQPPEEVPVGEYDNLVDSLVVGDGRVVRS